MIKKLTLLLLLMLACLSFAEQKAVGQASKGGYKETEVGGWNLGSLGVYYSRAVSGPVDKSLSRSEKKCYKKYNSFNVEQWRIEIGTPCRESQRIGTLLSANNFQRYNRYQELFSEMKPFIDYLFEEPVTVELRLILSDQPGFEKSSTSISFRKTHFPLYIISQFSVEDSSLEEQVKRLEMGVSSLFAHEFFHRYAHKFLKKKRKQRRRLNKNQNLNEEALASSVEICAAFAMGYSRYDFIENNYAINSYKEGLTAEQAFWQGPVGRSMKEQLTEKQIKSKFPIVVTSQLAGMNANYQIWGLFGTEVSHKDKEKIVRMLQYCKYLITELPSIEQLRSITEQQYQSAKQAEFYLAK